MNSTFSLHSGYHHLKCCSLVPDHRTGEMRTHVDTTMPGQIKAMHTSSETDQTNSPQKEVRHLREMIEVLRAELENLQLESDHAVQRAVADGGVENQQLKSTINVLRDELEKVRFDEKEHINQAVAAANDEIIQLKATINALRQDLEVQRLDNEEHARQTLSAANNEINQLRATVMALREQLEQHDAG